MTKLKTLHSEFKELKAKLFGGSMFVILDEESNEAKRYNQLLCFFHPEFRTSDWINPAI